MYAIDKTNKINNTTAMITGVALECDFLGRIFIIEDKKNNLFTNK